MKRLVVLGVVLAILVGAGVLVCAVSQGCFPRGRTIPPASGKQEARSKVSIKTLKTRFVTALALLVEQDDESVVRNEAKRLADGHRGLPPSVPIIVGHEVEIKAEGVAGVRKCLN